MLAMKRIYEDYDATDGTRVLVDRLWPRGIKKTSAHLDYWAKELAPSTQLRKWFNHEEEKMPEFAAAYRKELFSSTTAKNKMQELSKKSQHETLTLLFAAKSYEVNHVVVLLSIMKKEYGAKLTSTK